MHTTAFLKKYFLKGGKVMRIEQQVQKVIRNKTSLRRLKLCKT